MNNTRSGRFARSGSTPPGPPVGVVLATCTGNSGAGSATARNPPSPATSSHGRCRNRGSAVIRSTVPPGSPNAVVSHRCGPSRNVYSRRPSSCSDPRPEHPLRDRVLRVHLVHDLDEAGDLGRIKPAHLRPTATVEPQLRVVRGLVEDLQSDVPHRAPLSRIRLWSCFCGLYSVARFLNAISTSCPSTVERFSTVPSSMRIRTSRP